MCQKILAKRVWCIERNYLRITRNGITGTLPVMLESLKVFVKECAVVDDDPLTIAPVFFIKEVLNVNGIPTTFTYSTDDPSVTLEPSTIVLEKCRFDVLPDDDMEPQDLQCGIVRPRVRSNSFSATDTGGGTFSETYVLDLRIVVFDVFPVDVRQCNTYDVDDVVELP